MTSRTIAQPAVQLGREIDALLKVKARYERIIFVSAFVALRTILRLRDRLLAQFQAGCRLRLTVGIDLGGTSKEVLEELLRWNCEVFVFHNPISRATFHPKVYLFESASAATLIVGSNNLTDGGFYTNYEASIRYDFVLPADVAQYRQIVDPLRPFIEPQGATVQRLTAELIAVLTSRGQLTTEAQARERRRNQTRREINTEHQPANPFVAERVPLPPLLPQAIRADEPQRQAAAGENILPENLIPEKPQGVLVWRKPLSKSDALNVRPGSHPKGQVVMAQADFENPPGTLIDQTTYFRNLFRDFDWELEPGKHRNQEHTFIPMRIFIRQRDYGIRNFEISHKPSGEAGQRNSPTGLRWGGEFNRIVRGLHLTGAIFSLYETPDADAPFLIEIT